MCCAALQMVLMLRDLRHLGDTCLPLSAVALGVQQISTDQVGAADVVLVLPACESRHTDGTWCRVHWLPAGAADLRGETGPAALGRCSKPILTDRALQT
jgi:hypothetical protein